VRHEILGESNEHGSQLCATSIPDRAPFLRESPEDAFVPPTILQMVMNRVDMSDENGQTVPPATCPLLP
jgi:hypothetical protein